MCASCAELDLLNRVPSSRLSQVKSARWDYGTGSKVRDPDTGKYRRTRLFVLTLGHSRKSARLLTFRSSARICAELHEKTFRRPGGTTRLVLRDNLREGEFGADSRIRATSRRDDIGKQPDPISCQPQVYQLFSGRDPLNLTSTA